MHAADAPVRNAHGVRLAADVDLASFGRTHREISLRGQDILPKFSRPALLQASGDPDAAETVAWFELTEMREQRSLVAALGLRLQADRRRIGWCTLAARVESWSYRDGLLQSLSDYPWMRKAEPASARALLDASHFRRYWRAPVKFNTLPDARFSCQMSTACCKHDFEIFLPPEAQLLIDAMPWQSLRPQLSGTRLAVRPDGNLQLKEINDACRFLDTHGRCLVHQTLGRQPFGPCSVFPFAFAQTPEGIADGLSSICGSTRLGLGIAPLDREDDLRERLVQAAPRRPNGFRLAPGREVSWERFRDIEKALCVCLAADGLPMRRRLYVGSRLLGALGRDEPPDMNLWLKEPQVKITSELRGAIRPFPSTPRNTSTKVLPRGTTRAYACLARATTPCTGCWRPCSGPCPRRRAFFAPARARAQKLPRWQIASPGGALSALTYRQTCLRYAEIESSRAQSPTG